MLKFNNVPHTSDVQILIVEDSITQATRLRGMLERHGYSVVTAANGVRALEQVAANPPTLILSDIVMPEIDGYELCRRLKADPQTRTIPVILLTALTQAVDVVKGLECGADNFVFKPFEEKYLLARVTAVLANRHLRQVEESQMGVEIFFAGRKFFISSDRLQILNLLLSTYEAAVHKNLELSGARDELRMLNEDLEARVRERTAELEAEIAERKRAEERVEALNAALEQRVAQRTAELEAANAHLRQAREEADRANMAKSDFVSRMSHELRTPMNAVLGFAQLLELDGLTPEQHEAVGHIIDGGKHLLGLINEVLDISRIEAGHLALSIEPVEVDDLLRATIDLVQPLAAERQIRIAAPRRAARFVLADQQRLKQVLINLLSNAIKYNRLGGSVTLRFEERAERLRFAVADTGIGIGAEKLNQLFTPFERLGAEQSTVEGSGLGLAVTKRLIEAMGGIIWVDSVVGQGSTFWLELPMTQCPMANAEGDQSTPANDDPAPPILHRSLLCIDDNASNIKLIERVVRKRPAIELLVAHDGASGLDLAYEHAPDAILLDLNLPDISGHDVLRQIKRDPKLAMIPVIMVSADATPGRIERLIAAGARDYVVKPIDVKRLLEVLDATLHVEPA